MPQLLYPWDRPGTHFIGGWVGPRANLDGRGKSRPPLGFETQAVQPITSHYTDCATLTYSLAVVSKIKSLLLAGIKLFI